MVSEPSLLVNRTNIMSSETVLSYELDQIEFL